VPSVADANAVGVMTSCPHVVALGSTIRMLYDRVPVQALLSIAINENEKLPATVGVP